MDKIVHFIYSENIWIKKWISVQEMTYFSDLFLSHGGCRCTSSRDHQKGADVWYGTHLW